MIGNVSYYTFWAKSGQSNINLLRQPIRDGLPDLLRRIFLNEEGSCDWVAENIQVFQSR